MTQGIYAITHSPSGRVYVGAALDHAKRFEQHLDRLAKRKHHNKGLQECYSQDGAESLVFALLEPVADKKDLRAREDHWIAHYRDVALNSEKAGGYSPSRGSWIGPQIRQGVKHWLVENDVSQEWLAAELNMARPNLNRMLNSQQPRSVLWQGLFDSVGLDVVYRAGQIVIIDLKTDEVTKVLVQLVRPDPVAP